MWNVVGDVKCCVRAAIANNGSADEAFSVCEVQAPANVDLWRLMRQNEPMAKVVGAVDKICKLVMNYGMESITTGIYFGIYTDGQTEEPKPMIRVGTIWGDLEGVDDIADATSWEGVCGVDDEAYRLPSESLVEWRRAVLRMASDISGNGLIALNYFLPMVHTGYLANSCCEELVRRKLIPEAIHARVAYGYDSGDTIELGSLTSRTFTLK